MQNLSKRKRKGWKKIVHGFLYEYWFERLIQRELRTSTADRTNARRASSVCLLGLWPKPGYRRAFYGRGASSPGRRLALPYGRRRGPLSTPCTVLCRPLHPDDCMRARYARPGRLRSLACHSRRMLSLIWNRHERIKSWRVASSLLNVDVTVKDFVFSIVWTEERLINIQQSPSDVTAEA